MVLIFDLDDTLYDEMSFVKSGLRAVAKYGESSFGWDPNDSFNFMYNYLTIHGRIKVFDEWLFHHNHYSAREVGICVKIYRHHHPDIFLYSQAAKIIKKYNNKLPMYLVTDGHKITQKNKIIALNLQPRFKKIFITHQYGIKNAKPSLHCFKIIKRLESCQWSKMVYVGDNPAKDFVNLNRMGARTVRVGTGSHSSVQALTGYDGAFKIPNLDFLPHVLQQDLNLS
jgi:putative hydrolase of the HAD superfamily